MPERTIDTVLNYRASTSAAVGDIERLDSAVEQVENSTRRAEQAFDNMEQSAQRTAKASGEALNSSKGTGGSNALGQGASGLGSLGQLAGGLGGGALGGKFMLGSDLLSAAEGVNKMKTALPALASQMGTSTAMLGLLGGAVVALGVVSKIAAAAIEKSGEATRQYLGYEEDYWNLRINGTKEDAQARLDEITAQRQALQARRDEIQYILDQADATKGAVGAGYDVLQGINQLGKFTGLGQINAGGMVDLQNQLDDLNKQLGASDQEFNRLTSDLSTGVFAANDMKDAEKELAAQREKFAQEIVAHEQDRANAQIEEQKRLTDWTSQQVKDRLAELEIEQAARQQQLENLSTWYDAGALSTDEFNAAVEDVNRVIQTLGEEQSSLTHVVGPAVAAREAETQAIEAQTQAYTNLITLLQASRKTMEDVSAIRAKTEAKVAEQTEQFNQSQADTEAEYQRRRTDQVDDFEAGRAEREADFAEQRAAQETAYNERIDQMRADFKASRDEKEAQYQADELKRQADFRLRQRRAEEDHRRTLMDAAGALDALAVIREMQQYTTQQRREKEDFNRETDERRAQHQAQMQQDQKAFDQRLAQEARSFRKQQDQADAAFRKSETRQRQHFEDQQARQDAQYQREKAAREKTFADQIAQIRTAGQNEVNERFKAFQDQVNQLTGHHKTVLDTWSSHYDTLVQQIKDRFFKPLSDSASGASGTSSASGTSGTKGTKKYAAGGYTPGGIIQSDWGEYILNPQTTALLERGLGSLTQTKIQQLATTRSMSVSIGSMSFGDLGGYSPAQVRGLVKGAVMELVQEAAGKSA